MSHVNESTHIRKVRAEYTDIVDRGLRADDPRFTRTVHFVDEEGTVMIIRSAFVVWYKGWYCIFAEHHQTKIVHQDDVLAMFQYEHVSIDQVGGDL